MLPISQLYGFTYSSGHLDIGGLSIYCTNENFIQS